MQENASYCHVCFSEIKLRLFSHFSVILTIIVKNEWLATNTQNAILNNFEEYYMKISFTVSILKLTKGHYFVNNGSRVTFHNLCTMSEQVLDLYLSSQKYLKDFQRY